MSSVAPPELSVVAGGKHDLVHSYVVMQVVPRGNAGGGKQVSGATSSGTTKAMKGKFAKSDVVMTLRLPVPGVVVLSREACLPWDISDLVSYACHFCH